MSRGGQSLLDSQSQTMALHPPGMLRCHTGYEQVLERPQRWGSAAITTSPFMPLTSLLTRLQPLSDERESVALPMRQYLRRPIGQLANVWFTDRQSAGNPQALLWVELWACKPTSASEPRLSPSGLLRSESDTGPCASVFSNTGAGIG